MWFWFSMGVLATLLVEFALAHCAVWLNNREVAKAKAKIETLGQGLNPEDLKEKIVKWIDDEVSKVEIKLKLKEAAANTTPAS